MELKYHDKKFPVAMLIRMTEKQRDKLKLRAKGLRISVAEVIRLSIGK